MRALWRVVVKEVLQLRHDKKMIPVLLVGPILQLLALGYAANMDVNDIPTVLVDQDRTAESRALVERFTGSGYFDVVAGEDTVDRVEPWLVTGRAQVALVIAAG
jgi:ABC-2 type transport system permease protein